jgi:hypothetical protein
LQLWRIKHEKERVEKGKEVAEVAWQELLADISGEKEDEWDVMMREMSREAGSTCNLQVRWEGEIDWLRLLAMEWCLHSHVNGILSWSLVHSMDPIRMSSY